jgi:hypothetical protein
MDPKPYAVDGKSVEWRDKHPSLRRIAKRGGVERQRVVDNRLVLTSCVETITQTPGEGSIDFKPRIMSVDQVVSRSENSAEALARNVPGQRVQQLVGAGAPEHIRRVRFLARPRQLGNTSALESTRGGEFDGARIENGL